MEVREEAERPRTQLADFFSILLEESWDDRSWTMGRACDDAVAANARGGVGTGGKKWVQRQATISLRPQGRGSWPLTLFASDDPEVIDEVVSGKVQVAMMNPVDPLTLAYRGTGPYNRPLPLRIITVIPSEDQLAFAVSERSAWWAALGQVGGDGLPARRHPQGGLPQTTRRRGEPGLQRVGRIHT